MGAPAVALMQRSALYNAYDQFKLADAASSLACSCLQQHVKPLQ
jgi:hypothetical protein